MHINISYLAVAIFRKTVCPHTTALNLHFKRPGREGVSISEQLDVLRQQLIEDIAHFSVQGGHRIQVQNGAFPP